MRILTAILLIAGLSFADELEKERATEAFANRLLDFSRAWRKGETAKLRGFFGEEVMGNEWPRKWEFTGDLMGSVTRSANFDNKLITRMVRRHEMAKDLVRFGRLHGKIEHLSLQPAQSIVVDGDFAMKLKLEIIGTTKSGERVWTRGRVGLMTADKRVRDFRYFQLETRKIAKPPFSEVGIAAGLTGLDPAGLDHPTLGLAAYGAAAADVDGDGDIDLISTGHDGNTLYVNDGKGAFEAHPITTPRQATAPLFLDFDNDGDPDLFCSANGKQMLLENKGKLEFVDISEKAGVAVESIGFTATAGDINGDRVPDIYVAAYNNYGPIAPASWDDANNGLPNLLFVSKPDGTYKECAKEWGVAGKRWSYSAQFLDVNEDGKLDLYVTNDFGAGNRLYLHRGEKFEDAAKKWNVWDGGYGMGVDFGDYDNDGKLDMYVTKMSSTAGNRLIDRLGLDSLMFRSRLTDLAAGNSIYRRRADHFKEAGMLAAGWAWGGGFVDIDNDGFEDIFCPNGHFSGAKEKDT
ncbi:MAG: FG-GAP repeat domain-containing protein [Planctomycetota bacterium]